MLKDCMTPTVAFALVSFCLGQLGDGLNIFQGIYLVNIGWNEGAVGIALSLMGLTSLVVQTYAGDIIDKTTIDRRVLLRTAALVTAGSAMAIMFVRVGNHDHLLMYVTKVFEGIASSFIGPCLAALTLASFGPEDFDAVMASNVLWGHVGSGIAAVLAGLASYVLYPEIKACFFVIGFAALCAVLLVQVLPDGDQLLGRGLQRDSDNSKQPEVSSYFDVFSDRNTLILCITGFFFHFSNANVLLVLGELMSQDDDNKDDGGPNRSAIPLIAGAIVLSQVTMSFTTVAGDYFTKRGVGRKILFLTCLVTLPVRCALIIYWRNAGVWYLLSTQILDGIGGGFFGLIHPYLVADLTFGTGRFNVIMGMTASCFGLGATMSNFFGQMVVEKVGHVESIFGSFLISLIPIAIFSILMPETLNTRGLSQSKVSSNGYIAIA
jgi:MFS family permease